MTDIVITLDIDWVDDSIIKYAVDLLREYGIKATLFATHDSPFLKSLGKDYEIGLHPNFTNNNDWEKQVTDLKAIYPEAIGVRSHGLTQSSIIHGIFLNNGLKYEVNTFMPYRQGLSPYSRFRGDKRMVCIPFFWEDNTHFLNSKDFGIPTLKMDTDGLKVYGFHPMHIRMNTQSDQHYQSYKHLYKNPSVLKAYRAEGRGIGTLFVELLQYLRDNKIETRTCGEIYDEYTRICTDYRSQV